MVTDISGKEIQEGDRVIFINYHFGAHLDFGKVKRIVQKDCSPDWMQMNSITVPRLEIESESSQNNSEKWFFDIRPFDVVKCS